MADTKISALTELTTPATEDLLAVVDDPAGTPVTTKVQIGNLPVALSGIAKFWVKATANSTTITASFNMTSWADTATGQATGTIATDFSSANWAGAVSILDTAGAWDGTFTTGVGFGTQAAGTFRVDCSRMQDGGTAVAALIDPESWFASGFGAQ